MKLVFQVHLEVGEQSEDDGNSVWRCTHVTLSQQGSVIAADVHVDGYSGSTIAKIVRDDFGLPQPFAERLAIAARRSCGYQFLEISDTVNSLCNLNWLVRTIAYYSEAQSALRKIETALATAAEMRSPT